MKKQLTHFTSWNSSAATFQSICLSMYLNHDPVETSACLSNRKIVFANEQNPCIRFDIQFVKNEN